MTLARSACAVELRVRFQAASRATVIILILGLATDPVTTVLALRDATDLLVWLDMSDLVLTWLGLAVLIALHVCDCLSDAAIFKTLLNVLLDLALVHVHAEFDAVTISLV